MRSGFRTQVTKPSINRGPEIEQAELARTAEARAEARKAFIEPEPVRLQERRVS